MANIGSIQIDFTGNVKKLLTATDRVDKRLQKLQRDAQKTKKTIGNFAKAAVGVYALGKAFDSIILKSIDFNKQMEDSEIKLKAMIASSAGWETQTGRQVTSQERLILINKETAYTMGLIKDVNSQTAFGMQDLITSYSLMKPAMDRANVSTKDQIKLLKLVTNTASTFGLSNQELSTGIDDLASGTYRTSQSFGKMMKAIGVSREDIKTTTDLVGYLSEKMEATGKAQDSLTVAQSNFGVSFDNLRGKLTQPIFEQIKKDLKYFTHQMDTTSPQSMQVFADAITDMANTGISVIAALTLSITGLINMMKVVYGGYKKLDGLIGMTITKDSEESIKRIKQLKEELNSLGDTDRRGYSNSQRKRDIQSNIDSLKEEIKTYDEYKKIREEGDRLVESSAEQQKKLTDGIFKATHTLWLEKKKIVELDKVKKPEDSLVKNAVKNATKAVKTHKQNAKKLKKTNKDISKDFQKTFNNLGDDLADSLTGAMSPVANEVYNFYKTVSKLMAEASAQSITQSTAEGAAATGPAIAKAGSQAGIYGAVAMAALLAVFGMAGSGSFNTTVSQAEIDKASGVQEFDTKALTDIRDTVEEYQAPQLTATRSMLKHLESMDSKFASIANALSSSTGFDFDGSNYEATASSNWWGGTSKELIGSGLKFGEQTIAGFLQGVDVAGYQAELITNSSWFGLVTSESIKETEITVDPKIKKDLAKALENSIDAILEATTILGFDSSAIKKQLDQFALDLGKINFQDLNAEEKAQALSDAFSGQLNTAFEGAISSIASPQSVEALNNMAFAGEEYTATLVRAAVQHEVVSKQFALFGQTVTDFATSDILVQAAGGLEKFQEAMQIFVENFFSSDEQQEMQKLQLEMALQTYNVALPASKAAFRALVLETQQKIISTKAMIETMKAGIRADIAANNYKIKADGNYARSAVSTANNINKAAIHIGTSANDMIEAAKGAAKTASEIDYTDAYQADVGLQALEAELTNLEGLYGTLMSNMGGFADYYNGVESAASTATDRLNELEKSLLAIANLKAVWSGDDLSAKTIILNATRRETGLTNLTYDNFIQEFEKVTADGLGLDDKTLKAYQDMSSALRALHDVEVQKINKDISFYEGILNQINNTYTGNLSYLNSEEKLKYLDKQNDPNNSEAQLALEKKLSVTKEDYTAKFDAYIEDLKKKKTTDDVVDSLADINQRLQEIETAIETSTYQEAM